MQSDLIQRGTRSPAPRRLELEAGPLSMTFEPDSASLRWVRLGGREVLRGMYGAVRDRNWGTVEPRVSGLEVKAGQGGFDIHFEALCKEREIDFLWKGALEGSPAGEVRFRMEGRARSNFLRNRIGFCVLHPLDGCAGQPCRVEHPDGRVEEGRLPEEVASDQPFVDMRAITTPVGDGLWLEVRLEGEVFEMEDHRNWTDASFKTYGTPLHLPYPVEVRAGDSIAQTVTVRLLGSPPGGRPRRPKPCSPRPVEIAPTGAPPGPMPRVGLGCASHGEPLSARELERLRALGPVHLRLDLSTGEAGFRERLDRAAREARALGAALELAVFPGASLESELEKLVEALLELRPPLSHLLLFPLAEEATSEGSARRARKLLGALEPPIRVGGGTNSYFAELNRGRPPVEALDLVAYSVNPQVHAFDDATLVENLAGQAETVRSARKFSSSLPIAVTPITLRPRFFANATAEVLAPDPGELPSQVDPRQASLLGAAWTVGSIASLAHAGAASLTYYETTGWGGVMEREAGSPLPAKFPSLPGAVFPLYHVLADVLELAGGEVIPCLSSDPLLAAGLILRQGPRTRALLANLGPEAEEVELALPGETAVRLKVLDESSAAQALANPEAFRREPGSPLGARRGKLLLRLGPYAVARLEAGPTS